MNQDHHPLVSIRSPHRSEGRRSGAQVWSGRKMFQSAPLTEARGDDELDQLLISVVVSIRSPHRSEGRLAKLVTNWRSFYVSIRSPHRSEGRHSSLSCPVDDITFQSAPLTEARGDIDVVQSVPCHHRFQSAPLTEARGDVGVGMNQDHHPLVSIRSPHRSEGRRSGAQVWSGRKMFQSAPLTEARGDDELDQLLISVVVSIRSPHRSEGRLAKLVTNWRSFYVSIRSPHRSEGRHSSLSCPVDDITFQSAPLTEARGDIDVVQSVPCHHRFQSAPLTEARGDVGVGMNQDHHPLVSIRSPHRSEGRRSGAQVWSGRKMFQSAPLTEARGDDELDQLLISVVVSIRSPHRSEGRLISSRFSPSATSVSIRSPHRSEGRLISSRFSPSATSVSIRSPHRSEGRLFRWARGRRRRLVSIRSPHRSEGRLAGTRETLLAISVSIRSPHRSEGRQVMSSGEIREHWFQSAPLTEARGDAHA